MEWLVEHFSTIVVGILLLLLVVLAVVHLIKKRNKDGCGSCDGCPHAQDCTERKK